jgi:hypothetical protein
MISVVAVGCFEKLFLLTLWWPNFLLLNFSMKVLEKIPLCEKIPHEKSCLNISNGNKGWGFEIFWFFLKCIAIF